MVLMKQSLATEGVPLISAHCGHSIFFIFQTALTFQIVFKIMPTTSDHTDNTIWPRPERFFNFFLIQILPNLRCDALQSINGRWLSIEKRPFEESI